MEKLSSRNTPYLVFALALSVFALLVLAASVVLPMSAEMRRLLDVADDVLCALFFVDFLVTLWKADDRWRYFIRWGWIDLLSCIPSIDYLRVARMARVLRVLRVLRAIRSAKIIAAFILERRANSAMLAAVLIGLLLIVLASIGILQFEDVPEANIRTAEDALWWTMATITTVGYGDHYPVTTEGRILAAGLMVAGVGLAGIYTGFIAAWFLRPAAAREESRDERIARLASSLADLPDAELQALAARLERARRVASLAREDRGT
ncbi:MAG: potassium channel family protein [Dokdonella sp.]|uniref:potassium channel family protein n=1 Tax=Dokdonella sp. TaxID=2291710 RepID=UPI003F823950